MCSIDRISHFKRGYAALQEFYSRWLERIEERCCQQDQRRAAFYIWARYSMSMSTLDALLDPRLIPDVAVICRGCLEFDVSLQAVIKDEGLARDYLEFDKHAKAKYLKILSEQGDLDRMLTRREQFIEAFGEEPDDFRRSSWSKQGITNLIRSSGLNASHRMYNMLSHFAHGSVAAMQVLDGKISDPQKTLAMLIDSVYVSYLSSSHQFISFVWEPLVTPEGEQCNSEFLAIMSARLKSGR